MSDFDAEWVATVRAVCEPVFAAADVGFVAQVMMAGDVAGALLWEAEPLPFAQRYPATGIEDSYGAQWPPWCIDFWVYVRAGTRSAELRPEGFDDVTVALSGDAVRDGAAIGREFARMLGVPAPTG